MKLSDRVLARFLAVDCQTPASVAPVAGCSLSSAANYLSRAVARGEARKVWLPGMHPEGGWVMAIRTDAGEGPLSDPGLFASWTEGNVRRSASIYADFREYRLARRHADDSGERLHSAVDISQGSLVSCAKSWAAHRGAVGAIALRCLRPDASVASLARVAGVSPPTFSERLAGLEASGRLRSRYLPSGGRPEAPAWAEGDAFRLADGTSALPYSVLATTGIPFNLLPLVSAATGFPAVRESHLFSELLERDFGETASRAAELSGCLALTSPLSRFLPPLALKENSSRLTAILAGIGGRERAGVAMRRVVRARRAGGLVREPGFDFRGRSGKG